MDDDVTMNRNERLHRMIRDLGRTLAEAISDSSEASRTLRRLHSEGYAVSLALGRSPQGGAEETLTVMLEKRGREARLGTLGDPGLGADPFSEDVAAGDGVAEGSFAESMDPESLGAEDLVPPPGVPREAEPREPQFRMHGSDLAFLRSIGIDPTRSKKRRRR